MNCACVVYMCVVYVLCMCMCVVYVYVCTCVLYVLCVLCVYVCVCVYVYVCICLCVYVCCVCMYMPIGAGCLMFTASVTYYTRLIVKYKYALGAPTFGGVCIIFLIIVTVLEWNTDVGEMVDEVGP